MNKKKSIFLFLAGMITCKYFADKLCGEREYEIEKRNIQINLLDRWMTLREKGISLAGVLQERKCKKVGIYGLGMIGNHLYEELKGAGIEVVGIDRSDIYNNFQMKIYKPDQIFEDVDMIIVTPIDYDFICKNLKGYQGTIRSFQQLLAESEESLYTMYG